MPFYGRGLGTVMQADYIKFAFKIQNFRYRGDGLVWRSYIHWPPNNLQAIWSRIEDVSVIQKSSYGEFSVKIYFLIFVTMATGVVWAK